MEETESGDNCPEEVFANGGGAEWRGEACLQRWRRLRRI